MVKKKKKEKKKEVLRQNIITARFISIAYITATNTHTCFLNYNMYLSIFILLQNVVQERGNLHWMAGESIIQIGILNYTIK
jgi:lipopolysaccharide export system protein LptA